MASLASSLDMTPASLRSKSLGARNYRASFAPINGSSFKSLEQLKFQLGSMPRTYADLTTCVVRGKLSSESGAAVDVCFIEKNIYSIINRLEVSVANQQLDNIPNYNVLVHSMSDLGAGVMNSGQFPHTNERGTAGNFCTKTPKFFVQNRQKNVSLAVRFSVQKRIFLPAKSRENVSMGGVPQAP